MKTVIFTLAAVFGLGLGFALVGIEFGKLILATLLICLALATLIWAFSHRLLALAAIATPLMAPLVQTVTRPFARSLAASSTETLAQLSARSRAIAAQVRSSPFSPLLSGLIGFALGAALARDSSDLPAALLCGALTATLHLMAFNPNARRSVNAPRPDRIADHTQTHLGKLITALAPCRDPHLHVAARALRREALALAVQVDHDPAARIEAHRALSLWLPALVEAAEHLRDQCLTADDPAQTAALTATLTRVTTHLADLAAQTTGRNSAAHRREPGPLAQTAG